MTTMTLTQKLVRDRERKRDHDIVMRSGITSRSLGEPIEANPFSTSQGPGQHRLAVAWLQGWIERDRAEDRRVSPWTTDLPTPDEVAAWEPTSEGLDPYYNRLLRAYLTLWERNKELETGARGSNLNE